MKKSLLIANWKMNGSLSFNKKFFLELKELFKVISNNPEIAVCPPDIYISQIQSLIKDNIECIQIGSQNVSFEKNGAYTGQISLDMLQDYGVKYTIIGHSERRLYNKETDLDVAKKIKFVLNHSENINPILCVGENLEQRDSGNTELIIKSQIEAVFNYLKSKELLQNSEKIRRLVIAYEPIWAIGTGNVATANIADEACGFIKSLIAKINLELSDKVRIIYGGSVKSNNALELISQPNIDGFLVGGASLDAAEFVKIFNHMCN